jgi:MFS family permease
MSEAAEAGGSGDQGGNQPASGPGFGRNFWLVFWATFALNSSSNLFVLFPLFLVELGANARVIGAVVGTFSLAALVARPGVGALFDRNGHRRIATLLLAIDVFVIALYLTVHSLGWPLFAVRAAHGLVEGTARVALFAMVYEFLPRERAGQAMSIFSLCGIGSAGFAPILGEWLINIGGFPAFFACAIVLTTAAATAARMLPDDRDAVRAESRARAFDAPGYGAMLRDRALLPLWIATLMFSLSISSRLSFVAPYAQMRGVAQVAWYFAVYSAAAMAVRIFGGKLMDRVGLERMVAPSLAALAAGIAMIAGTGSMGMLYWAAIIGGAGHGYVYPALSAIVIRRTQARAAGRSSSIYQSLYDLGSMAGPYGLGAAAAAFGYAPMFAIAGALALAGALFFVGAEPAWRARRLA